MSTFSLPPRVLRTVVWSTGGVGSIAIDAVAGRPDMDLVGVWVHTPDKVGRDAGELAGRDPLGVAATHDADALIAMRPDCVVYAASGPERDAGVVPDYLRMLRAGINVVSTTSTSLVYPPAYYSPDWRDQLQEAALAGDASFYASGVFPGFASDQLALLLATQSKTIDVLRVTEVSLNDHYPVADVMMDGMGFGRPLDFEPMLKTPGFIEMAWRAPIRLMATGLGVEVTEVVGTLDRRVTERDIEVAFGTIPAGTCGAVRTRAAGVVCGREAIVVEHIIRMARDVAPDWPASDFDATYRVDIEGDPDVHCAMNLGDAEGHGAGRAAMAATAMRVVNAIPFVVDAPAGLLSSLDLPNTLPRYAFGAMHDPAKKRQFERSGR
ncbi:dihydrodipicolinate reductase [Mycolicibacterium litorale]|uniref:NAD(P)H-dependent amine dehydrogenase family protein n=1 Tax=Mycolicibacterium litorale TaxID=758802 RepID=UPI003CF36CBB